MRTPVKLYRVNLDTGKRTTFPILCIGCGRVVRASEAIVDIDDLCVYIEPEGCKPDMEWRELYAPPETVGSREEEATDPPDEEPEEGN